MRLSATMEWVLRDCCSERGLRVVLGRHGVAYSTLRALVRRGMMSPNGGLTASGRTKRAELRRERGEQAPDKAGAS